MNKIIFHCGAWGEPYISNYVNYVYYNHLACLKQLKGIDYDYYFYTSAEEAPKIQELFKEQPNLKVVTKNSCNFVTNLPMSDNERMQGWVMELARSLDASLFVLVADNLYPINSFSNILELSSRKELVFCVPWFKANSEILTHLKDCDYSSRSLVKLGLTYIHTKFMRNCMDDDIYKEKLTTVAGYAPTLLYWKFKNSGFLIKSFHLHPLFFKKIPRLDGAIDQGEYFSTAYSDEDIYRVTDSDIAFCIDLDMNPSLPLPSIGTVLNLDPIVWGNQIHPKPGCNLTQDEIREWAVKHVHRNLRQTMKYNIYMHSEDLNDEWNELTLKVNKYISETYDGIFDRKEMYLRGY